MTSDHRQPPCPSCPVLLVGPLPPPVNGMSVAVEILARGLEKRGWRVNTIDIADRSRSRGGQRHGLWRAITILNAAFRSWLLTARASVIYVAIAQSRVGLIRDLAICLPALIARKPLVLHLHGGNYRSFFAAQPGALKAAARWMLQRATRIVVLSTALRNQFDMIARWEYRTAVVPNPSTAPIRGPRAAPSGTLRVLYLSNLLEEKGYRDLLLSLTALGARLPDWRVEVAFAGAFQLGGPLFCDTGAMKADFEALASALPPNVTARWHGVVTGTAKTRLFEEADVFALPTYYVNEGQPIAIIEALAHGLPVVATRHRAIPETVPPSHAAIGVDPRSPEQIADRLALLAEAPDLYERLSTDAVARARTFDPEVHLELMAGILTSAAQIRRA